MQGVFFRSTAFLLLTFALGALTACDSGSSSSKDSSSSTSSSSGGVPYTPAEVQVHFPPAVASTTESTLTIRGSVSQAAEIAAVYINGEAVSTEDALLAWTYDATLQQGVNEFAVTYDTNAGETLPAATLAITRQYPFISPRQLVLDEALNRLFVLDYTHRAVISVDATTGERTQLSPAAGTDNLLVNPSLLAYNPDAAELLIYQKAANAFIRVGTDTGNQTVAAEEPLVGVDLGDAVTAISYAGGGNYIIAGTEDAYIDKQGNRTDAEDEDGLLSTAPLLYSYNPTTGAKSLVTSFDSPNSRIPVQTVIDVSTHPDSPNFYLLDTFTNPLTGVRGYRVLRVAKANGARHMVLPARDDDGRALNGAWTLANPSHLKVGANDQTLWLVDDAELIQVDLTTFVGTEISGDEVPEDGEFGISGATDIVIDASYGQAFTVSDRANRILRVDTATGTRSVLSANQEEDSILLSSPLSIALNKNRHELYIADRDRFDLLTLDLVTGEKTVLVRNGNQDDNDPTVKAEVNYPLTVVSDHADTVFTLDNLTQYSTAFRDSRNPRLYAVNPETRDVRSLHRFNSSITTLKDLAFAPEQNTLYVLANRGSDYIHKVSMDNDKVRESYFSTNALPNNKFLFNTPRAISWDAEYHRLLVADSGDNALIAVDGHSGERSILSGTGIPENGGEDLRLPMTLNVDAARGRALVVDTARTALISVDLASGRRTQLFTDPFFTHARDAALFEELNILFVSNDLQSRILAIDLSTGKSVTLTF